MGWGLLYKHERIYLGIKMVLNRQFKLPEWRDFFALTVSQSDQPDVDDPIVFTKIEAAHLKVHNLEGLEG